ncbi:hypothetical protein M0R45_030436 [Rubus argutus]|uniref:Uncharacterized protein n=1 Tax=Rubus argutus TaxID=59490 RepID=A0AAW1WEP9_RUBAR
MLVRIKRAWVDAVWAGQQWRLGQRWVLHRLGSDGSRGGDESGLAAWRSRLGWMARAGKQAVLLGRGGWAHAGLNGLSSGKENGGTARLGIGSVKFHGSAASCFLGW